MLVCAVAECAAAVLMLVLVLVPAAVLVPMLVIEFVLALVSARSWRYAL